MALGTFSALQDWAPVPRLKVREAVRLFLILIPIMAGGVQCRTDAAFAYSTPFVDFIDETHYLIHNLIYVPCRGAFWYAQ